MGQYVFLGREWRASGRNGDSRYNLHTCKMGHIFNTHPAYRLPVPPTTQAWPCWKLLADLSTLLSGSEDAPHALLLWKGELHVSGTPSAPLQGLSASPHTVATATAAGSTQAAIASHRCSQTDLTSVSLPVETPLTLSHGAQNSHILSLEVNAFDHTGWKPVNPCSPSSLGGSSDMHVPRLPERSHGIKLSHPYQWPAP